MKTWQCVCGTRVFFENTACNSCQRSLGYDAILDRMRAVLPDQSGVLRADDGDGYRYCANQLNYQVCNWLIPEAAPDTLCQSCRLNETIPALLEPARRDWWASMEAAKRRLVYSLLQLALPVQSRWEVQGGLGFAFMEDRRSNPWIEAEFIPTGHADGLITVNLAEANAVFREQNRQATGESYRTLLGHFRHESGHYYFDRLLRCGAGMGEFQGLFGDADLPYEDAMAAYYAGPPQGTWTGQYISAYAQSHPLEDWAECWAHYLHIVDTLETAACYGLVSGAHVYMDVDDWMPDWSSLTVTLNDLNRSMGLQDAYPFSLGQGAIAKLHFVHQVIVDAQRTGTPNGPVSATAGQA